MAWGIYNLSTKLTSRFPTIQEKDVPGPGYNWYKAGTYKVNSNHYMFFFSSWVLQCDFDDLDSDNPNQQYEVWARIKFEGPAFPHGNKNAKNGIFVERIILIKKD